MSYNIRDDSLYYKHDLLGPSTALYVDFNELLSNPNVKEGSGIIRHGALPHRIDMVFCAGDKVVGCESKKPTDLVQSHADGRLARQIKTIGSVCDITLVLARGGLDVYYLSLLAEAEESHRARWRAADLFNDLFVRYPTLGVYVVGVPDDDEKIPAWLEMYQKVLADPRSAIKALARTDDRPGRVGTGEKAKPGEFLRNIPGVGKATAKKLYDHFGSTKVALNSSRLKWKKLKIGKKVIDARDKALS